MIRLITDLGDSAFLLPASAVLLGYFLYHGSMRTALLWTSTLALCAALTIVLKIGFNACGGEMPLLNMRTPSGHASLSATFYTCCALMISADKERWIRVALLGTSAALVILIAVSRIILQAHTISEVVAGILIGLCCVGWFSARYFARPPLPMPWHLFVGALIALALLAHGRHLTLEGVIEQIARLVRTTTVICGTIS